MGCIQGDHKLRKAILNLNESQGDARWLQDPELHLQRDPRRCRSAACSARHLRCWKRGAGVWLRESIIVPNKLENYLNIIPCGKLTAVDESVDEGPTKTTTIAPWRVSSGVCCHKMLICSLKGSLPGFCSKAVGRGWWCYCDCTSACVWMFPESALALVWAGAALRGPCGSVHQRRWEGDVCHPPGTGHPLHITPSGGGASPVPRGRRMSVCPGCSGSLRSAGLVWQAPRLTNLVWLLLVTLRLPGACRLSFACLFQISGA